MAHIRFMHDAHLGCALFFLDMLAEYTLLSMTVMVTPCPWYVVGMKLVCPMSKFSQAPFARAPFGECRQKAENADSRTNFVVKYATARGHLIFNLFLTSLWPLLNLEALELPKVQGAYHALKLLWRQNPYYLRLSQLWTLCLRRSYFACSPECGIETRRGYW